MADQGTNHKDGAAAYRIMLPRQSNNTASDTPWNPEDLEVEQKHEKKKKKMEAYRRKMISMNK